MTYSIQIVTTKSKLNITLIKGDITVKILTTAKELWKTHKLRIEDINYKAIKSIIEANKLQITKIYDFSSKVEEWSTELFTFKKEDNLIVCVLNANREDFIYLKEEDLPNRFNLSLADYEAIKVIKSAEKEAALVLANNLNNNFSLDIPFDQAQIN
jgi:hypothetical protein